jgi:hypothetical protein
MQKKGFDFLSKAGCKRGLNTTGRYTWFLGSLNVFAIYVSGLTQVVPDHKVRDREVNFAQLLLLLFQ